MFSSAQHEVLRQVQARVVYNAFRQFEEEAFPSQWSGISRPPLRATPVDSRRYPFYRVYLDNLPIGPAGRSTGGFVTAG